MIIIIIFAMFFLIEKEFSKCEYNTTELCMPKKCVFLKIKFLKIK